VPAVSARGRAARLSGRGLRSAARRRRPTACSVNRTLATGARRGIGVLRARVGARVRYGQGEYPGVVWAVRRGRRGPVVKAARASARAAPDGQARRCSCFVFIVEREPEWRL
jgi:hypothetical protein